MASYIPIFYLYITKTIENQTVKKKYVTLTAMVYNSCHIFVNKTQVI